MSFLRTRNGQLVLAVVASAAAVAYLMKSKVKGEKDGGIGFTIADKLGF